MGIESRVRSALHGDSHFPEAFLADVLAGLSLPQKAIPARWFYDERGSQLFEQITALPEYYPTRAETEILAGCGEAFAERIGVGRAVVEFGSGSSVKTPHLLSAISPAAYVPIDISGAFLRESAQALASRFPQLPVVPVEADFTRQVTLPPEVAGLARLGFFPGSTIGNFVPFAAVDLLRSIRRTLGDGAMLLIGMDRIKQDAMLLRAYDDAAGVTAAFNLNLLARINRELGGDLPTHAFRHRVRWNEARARIEMHLEATRDITFRVADRGFAMRAGETIHTENSHKYDGRSSTMLLLAGGWTPITSWQDSAGLFVLILAGISDPNFAP